MIKGLFGKKVKKHKFENKSYILRFNTCVYYWIYKLFTSLHD